MMDLNQRFKDLMTELESNIESKKDLEYLKNTFSNMFLQFLNDINGVSIKSEERMQQLEEKQRQLEEIVKKIEKDIYINDNYDFEIVCPYCNCEFEADLDEMKSEVRCPECNNIIELDWNEENENSSCSGSCSCCHGECSEEDTYQDENEDDM